MDWNDGGIKLDRRDDEKWWAMKNKKSQVGLQIVLFLFTYLLFVKIICSFGVQNLRSLIIFFFIS